jgi:hypothetical protein
MAARHKFEIWLIPQCARRDTGPHTDFAMRIAAPVMGSRPAGDLNQGN